MAINIHQSGITAGQNSTQIINNYINHVINNFPSKDIGAYISALECPNMVEVMNKLSMRDKLLKDSMEWILKDPQYVQWQSRKNVSLLWIKGGAGKGKTMMSIYLIEELRGGPHEQSPVVAYFFCQNTDVKFNTIKGVMRGLIQCLLTQKEELFSPVLDQRWDPKKEGFREPPTTWEELWTIFKEMVDRVRSSRIYVVIDALDECEDKDMATFLAHITHTGSISSVKWLLTSRPSDITLDELFTTSERLVVSMEQNSHYVADAVKTYIDNKVHQLAQRNGYERHRLGLSQELKGLLVEKAKGTFLWASLVCNRLEKVHSSEALATVEELPPELTPLYRRIFERLRDLPHEKDENRRREIKERIDLSMRLLKLMLTAYRPLSKPEVSSAIGLDARGGDIEQSIDRCASFITKRGNVIEFVHQSAKDFLGQKELQATLVSYGPWGHSEIGLSCVSYLSQTLRIHLASSFRRGSEIGPLEASLDIPETGELARMDYAATFWAKHISDAWSSALITTEFELSCKVEGFLRTKLLEWLECLVFLDRLSHAIEALRLLANLKETSPLVLVPTPFATLVQDATRFLLRHYSTIAKSPSQLYRSAIVLSPQMSPVRIANQDKKPRWLKEPRHVETTWNSLVQTLRGHSEPVMTVAYSPDGKHIASGSRDSTIKLWSATTGVQQKTLRGHSGWVTAVNFSPSSKHVASGSYDRTVKLWDAATGVCVETLTGHSDHVTDVTFSLDGQLLASSSYDKTIILWNAVVGKCRETLRLEGHSETVTAVVFAQNSKHVASSSDDNTVKLWDAASGQCQKTLVGHFGSVRSVTFSPNGNIIASASYDKTVRLWDIEKGDLLRTLEGPFTSLETVAFSPDKKYIISGSWKTIRLWDAATGDYIKTLKCPDQVTAVAFSPNGKRLASNSDDNTVKLWDHMAADDQQTPRKCHTSKVSTVHFSPNGSHVASGSHDGSISLWDTTTDSSRMLKGHTSRVTAIAFSSDNKLFASASIDQTVMLWDVSGIHKKTLEGHLAGVTTVVFHPDNKHIASGSFDSTVKLWDTIAGNHKTLKGHSNCVTAIAFSPDGLCLASGSEDNTIKLWGHKGECRKTLEGHTDPITALTFSPEGTHLVSSSFDVTIKLWDVAKILRPAGLLRYKSNSYRLQRDIKTAATVTSLRYSEDGAALVTNIGTIPVNDTLLPRSLQQLWIGDMWLRYGKAYLLKLPPDCDPLCQATHGDQVAVGLSNGQVLILGVDRNMLEEELNP